MRVTISEWFKVKMKEVESRLELAETAPLFAFKSAMSAKHGVHARMSNEEWSRRFERHQNGLPDAPAAPTSPPPAPEPAPVPAQEAETGVIHSESLKY